MTSKIKVNILADGGDNSIITSDGAGSFTASSGLASSVASVGSLANTPAFYAYVAGAGQSVPNSTTTKVVLDATTVDTNSAFNTSTYRFTVPSGYGGVYNIVAGIGYNATADWDTNLCLIYKNGGEAGRGSFSQTYDTTPKTSIMLNLSVGDYVELYTQQSSGSSQTLRNQDGETYLYGYRLIGA